MKSVAYIILASLAMISCDNRKKYIQDHMPNPVLNKMGQGVDSVKLTLKSEKTSSLITLKVDGIKGNKYLSYSYVVGNGSLMLQRDTMIENKEYLVENGENIVNAEISELGMNLITFTLKDQFDKSVTIDAKIYAFENLGPLISFANDDVRYKGVLSKYEYTLDASKCTDKDSKYGGFIKSYEYAINDLVIKTKEPKIDWVFRGPGNYTISLKITDNDNTVVSTSFIKTIN